MNTFQCIIDLSNVFGVDHDYTTFNHNIHWLTLRLEQPWDWYVCALWIWLITVIVIIIVVVIISSSSSISLSLLLSLLLLSLLLSPSLSLSLLSLSIKTEYHDMSTKQWIISIWHKMTCGNYWVLSLPLCCFTELPFNLNAYHDI